MVEIETTVIGGNSGSAPALALHETASAGHADISGSGVAGQVGGYPGTGAIHDGTTQPDLDMGDGLVSALGGQDVHALEFAGPEIQPAVNGTGTGVDLEEGRASGSETWVSHPSAMGYQRVPTTTSSTSTESNSPVMDSGLPVGGSLGGAAAQLSDFYGGTEQNPTSAQSAPTPRAEQAITNLRFVNPDNDTASGSDQLVDSSLATPLHDAGVIAASSPDGSEDPPPIFPLSDENRQFLKDEFGFTDDDINLRLQFWANYDDLLQEGLNSVGNPFSRPAPGAPTEQGPPDPLPGLSLAADFLAALAQYLRMSGKQAVLGDWSDEQTGLGTGAQIASGLTGLDTATDVRDLAAAVNDLKKNPNDATAKRRVLIYGAAVLIPFLAGGLMAKMVGGAAEEGAEAVGGAAAKNADEGAEAIAEAGAASSGLTNATRLTADELATGQRLEAQLGKPLTESPHIGAEYIDELGRTYDAIGVPKASQFWNEKQFLNSIDEHLLKSNDFTVIDLTGFTPEQIETVRSYLSTLTEEQLTRIIRIGF